MDLILALYVLYGLQCVAWLPGGACLFVATLFGSLVSRGPGFRLLHPRPSAPCSIALRFPLCERGGRLSGRGAATWLADRAERGDETIDLGALRSARADHTVVRVGGRPFARGCDDADARRIAALLRELADTAEERRGALLDGELARAASLAGFAAARERFERAAWPLGWTSDVYWICLFLLLPGSMLFIGSDFGVRLLVPALAILHVATLLCLAYAHATLRPGERGERVQLLFGAALYPPGLLRAYAQLRSGALGRFAPSAAAVALLDAEPRRAFLRAELVRAARQVADAEPARPALELARREERALHALVREAGESPQALLAAPARSDPLARGYCPACRCEYRRADGECSDCEVALEPYGARRAGAPREMSDQG